MRLTIYAKLMFAYIFLSFVSEGFDGYKRVVDVKIFDLPSIKVVR